VDQEDQGDYNPPWWTRTGFYILLMNGDIPRGNPVFVVRMYWPRACRTEFRTRGAPQGQVIRHHLAGSLNYQFMRGI